MAGWGESIAQQFGMGLRTGAGLAESLLSQRQQQRQLTETRRIQQEQFKATQRLSTQALKDRQMFTLYQTTLPQKMPFTDEWKAQDPETLTAEQKASIVYVNKMLGIVTPKKEVPLKGAAPGLIDEAEAAVAPPPVGKGVPATRELLQKEKQALMSALQKGTSVKIAGGWRSIGQGVKGKEMISKRLILVTKTLKEKRLEKKPTFIYPQRLRAEINELKRAGATEDELKQYAKDMGY